jgi:hypothetical protein
MPKIKTKAVAKPLWLLQAPVANGWRSDYALGVAFTDPVQGFTGEWGPRGPLKDDTATENAKAQDTNAQSDSSTPNTITSMFASLSNFLQGGKVNQQAGDSDKSATADTPTKPQPTADTLATKWPKTILPDIYTKDNIVQATDVDTILSKHVGGGIAAYLQDVLRTKFSYFYEKEDATHIGLLKRITMDQPVEKIEALLKDPLYKDTMIRLVKLGQTEKLFVATQIVVCGSLTKEELKKSSINIEAGAKDPTGTTAIKVDGEFKHVKNSTLKGAYVSEVIIGMVYRPITYLELDKNGHWMELNQKLRNLLKGERIPDVDFDVGSYKAGFYIGRSEQDGNMVLFLGDDETMDDGQFGDLTWILAEGVGNLDDDDTTDDGQFGDLTWILAKGVGNLEFEKAKLAEKNGGQHDETSDDMAE